MVKSTDNGSVSIAPFLKKCYEMVDDESTDSIISWGKNNGSFVVWDKTEFCIRLLPKYFKHNNFSSFVRQLNIYGFRKIDTDCWEFVNEGFIRGQKDLLKNISRRKHPQGSDQCKASQLPYNSVEACENVGNARLWKEVENLKTDKNAVMQELVKLRQNQETADNKLLLLKDRLQGMEKNQQQMLSFLIMAMQSPRFLFQLLKPKENNWHVAEAGNMLDKNVEDSEPVPSDGMIVRYQPPVDEASKPVFKPEIENALDFDASSEGMKDFWMNNDFVKVLMDDSHIPFAPPDLHDDGAWEELLANPFLEHGEEKKKDEECPSDSGMEVEVTEMGTHLDKSHSFELLLQNMGNSLNLEIEPMVNGSQLGTSKNLELQMEQVGDLTSDSNQKNGISSK